MTREEIRANAIHILDNLKPTNTENSFEAYVVGNVLTTAIQAIKEQEELEKTYIDFCRCESGEGWLRIDGKKYFTDVGYALEGIKIFMKVFKQRLAESENKDGIY